MCPVPFISSARVVLNCRGGLKTQENWGGGGVKPILYVVIVK